MDPFIDSLAEDLDYRTFSDSLSFRTHCDLQKTPIPTINEMMQILDEIDADSLLRDQHRKSLPSDPAKTSRRRRSSKKQTKRKKGKKGNIAKLLMNNQRLVFDGFMRIHIFSKLDGITSIPIQLIIECHKYYIVHFDKLHIDYKLHKVDQDPIGKLAVYHSTQCFAPNTSSPSNQSDEPPNKRSIRLDPDDHDLRWKTGRNLMNQGKYKEALKQFMKLDDNVPEYILKVAECHYSLNNKNSAKRSLQKLVKIAPKSIEYQVDFCLFLENNGEFGPAYNAYQSAMEELPLSDEIAWRCSELLLKHCKYGQALSLFDKASQLNPNDPYYLRRMAQCFEELGKIDEADQCYLKAIQCGVNTAQFYGDYGWFLYRVNKPNEGKTMFDKALAMQPEDECILMSIALCLRDLSYYQMSEKYFKRCLKMTTRQTMDRTHSSYAFLLIAMKRYDDAMYHLDQCINCSSSPFIYFYYGLIHHHFGRTEKGNEYFVKSVNNVSAFHVWFARLYGLHVKRGQVSHLARYVDEYESMLRKRMDTLDWQNTE